MGSVNPCRLFETDRAIESIRSCFTIVVEHFGATIIGSVIDLLDVRIPVTHLMSQSPGHERVLAARIFHPNRHAIAARVFDLKHHAIEQALAAKVFYLDHHGIKRAPAPKVVHLNHHVIWQSLAPDRFSSELR